MALDKQVHLYAVDTGNFYSNHEKYLHNKNAKLRREKNYIGNARKLLEKELSSLGYAEEDITRLKSHDCDIEIKSGSEKIASEYQRFSELYKHKVGIANKIKDKLLSLLQHKLNRMN